MNSIAFDTHAAASRFKRAGFTEDQIEALVEVTRETTALPDISTLATKADIVRLEVLTKSDIARLGDSTKAEISRLEVSTKADISRLDARFVKLEASIDSRFDKMDSKIESKFSQLEAKIASTQVQSLTILISAMAFMIGLATVLPKLVH